MYALVKVSDTYDVMRRRHIKKNKQISSKLCTKLNNLDRLLIACNGKCFIIMYTIKKYKICNMF